MRRQLVLAKIIVTNHQTKMHKLTVITEPTTRKTSKLLNERRLNNYIWMNQLNKANAKRSTSLKNIKDWLPGRSVYESAASVPWNSRIMGVHENLWSVTESHTSWHCSLLCRKKHFRCQVCVRPLTCSQWRKPVHSRSPADRLFLNFAKRSVASASTKTVESLTDTLPVVRGKLALLARLKQQPATQERWSTLTAAVSRIASKPAIYHTDAVVVQWPVVCTTFLLAQCGFSDSKRRSDVVLLRFVVSTYLAPALHRRTDRLPLSVRVGAGVTGMDWRKQLTDTIEEKQPFSTEIDREAHECRSAHVVRCPTEAWPRL